MEHPPSAASRALATPEILELILLHCLTYLVPPTNRDDRRSDKTQTNADILLHIIRLTPINSTWRKCILQGPPELQRALFLRHESSTVRSWTQYPNLYPSQQSYYRGLAFRAPVLNPVIQMSFEGYKFRYWRSGLGAEGPRHHAYLILTRRHILDARERMRLGYGKVVRGMFLAQPPPTEVCATIWERDDEVGIWPTRTTGIQEASVCREEGLRLDDVLGYAGRIFDECPDLVAVKVTTV